MSGARYEALLSAKFFLLTLILTIIGVSASGCGGGSFGSNQNSSAQLPPPQSTPQSIITLFAGSLTQGYAGDGGPATSAQFFAVWHMATDSSGNVYLCDDNNVIRKVDRNGIITTFAGDHNHPGFSGDGGLAVNAGLLGPQGVAVDAAGNVYIADTLNDVIRKVDPAGVIHTIAGTPNVTGYSGDGGPASQAVMWGPVDLALDNAGNLYFVDSYNDVVRRIDTNGTISTVAGNPLTGLFGDGGPATSASIFGARDIAVSPSGDLFINDWFNSVIRKVDRNGIITTYAGSHTLGQGYAGDGGPAIQAELNSPTGIAFDSSGNLYVGDQGRVIRRVDISGTITRYAGLLTTQEIISPTGNGGPALNAIMLGPFTLTVDPTGNLYVSELKFYTVRKITHS